MISPQRHLFDMPRDVAYLNTAYMGPLMHSVAKAGEAGLRLKARPWNLTIPDFFDPVTEARALFAQMVHGDAAGVAIVPSASYGIAVAALNLSVGAGRHVIVLKDQFPSHVYSWKRLADTTGGTLKPVTPPPGQAATEAVLAAINSQTAIVAVPNVLWTTGAKVDLLAVRARCDEVGAALVLDLTQSAGAMEINFADVRPDFAVAATYKWLLGPYALGFLWAAPDRRNGVPLEEGWITRANGRDFAGLTDYTDEYMPGAERYDMGERANFSAMPAAVAALRQLLEWGVPEIEATLTARNAMLSERLSEIGLSPTPAEARGGHFLGAALPEQAPVDLIAQLAGHNVHVSARGGSLRITPHLWNDDEDFDKLISALNAVLPPNRKRQSR
ncbi:MAG: aminotransferase class V-fold PLP-dependent enzyme [Pikeienuella sp.]